MGHKVRGFTLVELMIVVAIIAIIAAVAYPSYQDSIRKTRRAEAKTDLLQKAQQMERCFTQRTTYVNCTTVLLGNTPSGYYNVTSSGVTATAFTLTATAIGTQATDTDCATFTINEKGSKAAADSGSANTTASCW